MKLLPAVLAIASLVLVSCEKEKAAPAPPAVKTRAQFDKEIAEATESVKRQEEYYQLHSDGFDRAKTNTDKLTAEAAFRATQDHLFEARKKVEELTLEKQAAYPR